MNIQFGDREHDKIEVPVAPTEQKTEKIKSQLEVDRIFKEREQEKIDLRE